MPQPSSHRAFTLIELLVVITIIVVLLALLVPSLDKAVYEAELVTCAGRLRVWGGMAISFAQDHQRRLPMAFGPAGNWSNTFDRPAGARVLDRISDITENESNGNWKSYGTPWETWLKYGMNDKLAVCPIWKSSGIGPSGNFYYDTPATPAPQRLADFGNLGWGPQVWIGYQWIAGTDMTQPHSSTGSKAPEAQPNLFAWNNRPPASKLSNAGSNSVLASDLLWMNSGWATPPNNFRAVAHPTTENPAQPRSMGIAFGDTHVGVERENSFEQPQVFGTNGSPSQAQYSYSAGAAYYWWGK